MRHGRVYCPMRSHRATIARSSGVGTIRALSRSPSNLQRCIQTLLFLSFDSPEAAALAALGAGLGAGLTAGFLALEGAGLAAAALALTAFAGVRLTVCLAGFRGFAGFFDFVTTFRPLHSNRRARER